MLIALDTDLIVGIEAGVTAVDADIVPGVIAVVALADLFLFVGSIPALWSGGRKLNVCPHDVSPIWVAPNI